MMHERVKSFSFLGKILPFIALENRLFSGNLLDFIAVIPGIHIAMQIRDIFHNKNIYHEEV